MKKTLTFLSAVAAVTMLAGCASDGYYGTRASYSVGYYDGYYGPYPGGYWRGDYFYYLGPDRHYHRDVHHHFRHRDFSGGHRFRAEIRHNDRDDHDDHHKRRHDRDHDHDRDHHRDRY